MATKMISNISSRVGPDRLGITRSGNYNYTPRDANEKFISIRLLCSTTNSTLLTAAHDYYETGDYVTVGTDTFMYFTVMHLGTTGGGASIASDSEGVIICLPDADGSAVTAAYNIPAGIVLASNEVLNLKIYPVALNLISCIKIALTNGVPSGAGSGDAVDLSVDAIVRDGG